MTNELLKAAAKLIENCCELDLNNQSIKVDLCRVCSHRVGRSRHGANSGPCIECWMSYDKENFNFGEPDWATK